MMEFGLIAALAVILAMTTILMAVLTELAPAGGLTGRGKWLLVVGLGAGVLAFSFKLLVVSLMLLAPSALVQHALAALTPVASKPPYEVQGPEPIVMALPRYVWLALPNQAMAPADNPGTADKVALGQRLFNDKNLSLNREVACASCHDLVMGAGADGLRVSKGLEGKQGTRNAPTVWNAAFQQVLFWDGRAASLEEQAKGPLINPVEMAMPSHDAVVERVRADPIYAATFDRVFGQHQAITIDNIAKAIASYERTLISPDSPYDRFVRGDKQALSLEQLRGMALFDAVGCSSCHAGPNFSAASVFGSGAPMRLFPATQTVLDSSLHLTDDTGLAPAKGQVGVWRVPSLRNVALTAPYFHNGSVARLEDAVRLMARVQLGLRTQGDGWGQPMVFWSGASHTMSLVQPRLFSEQDVSDVSAFLRALSSEAIVEKQRMKASL